MSDIESIKEKQGLIKVPTEGKDSKYRRVAKFLFLIGSKQAAAVLKQLDDDQVQHVIAELVTIRSVDKDEATQILDEFSQLYEQSKNAMGGRSVAKEILQEAYGEEKADEILERAVPETSPKPFTYLRDIETEQLALLLKDELPSACAVVLSHLPPKQAAAFINSISDETRKKDIILHLAKMTEVNTDVLQAMSDMLRKKLVDISVNTGSLLDGKSVLAKILRNASPDIEKSILAKISDDDQELANDIIKRIYCFDDILLMSDKDVRVLVSGLTDTEFRFLIYNRSAEIRKKLLTNISKHKALLILDDEKIMPPPLPRDCLNIEKKVVSTMIALANQGSIIIPKDESDKLVY